MKQQHIYLLIFLSFIMLTGFVVKRGPGGGGSINSFSKYIENPAVETFETIHHFKTAATATSIHCQCRGSTPVATMQWNRDDGSPSSVDAGTIACDAEEEDTNLTGDAAFAAGDDLDLKITAITGTVTDCSFIIYF